MTEDLALRIAMNIELKFVNRARITLSSPVPEGTTGTASLDREDSLAIARAAIAEVRASDVRRGPSLDEIAAGVKEYDNWSCVQAILEDAAKVRADEAAS